MSVLFGLTATSWYLSFTLHVVGYVIAAVLFYFLGRHLLPDREEIQTTTLRASLDDVDQLDEAPALQIVPNIGLERQEEVASSVQQIANDLETFDDGKLPTVVGDAQISVTGADDLNDRSSGDTFFFDVPESGTAVTQGSFTAWTSPENPAPGESYQIIIEMKLPRRTKRYRTSDLSGRVIGTDGYRQHLPFDSRAPYASRVTAGAAPETISARMRIDVEQSRIQLVVSVPGAQRLVKDTIEIKSRLLKEEQKLELVFGRKERD